MALPRMCYLDWWPPNDRNQSGLAPEGYAISRLFEPMLPHRIRAVGSLDRNDAAMAHSCQGGVKKNVGQLIYGCSGFDRPARDVGGHSAALTLDANHGRQP